jgi:hypothetical protein
MGHGTSVALKLCYLRLRLALADVLEGESSRWKDICRDSTALWFAAGIRLCYVSAFWQSM